MAGVAGDQIQITAQELPQDLDDLMALGVRLNACSLNQLDRFGQLAPGGELSVRINPGVTASAPTSEVLRPASESGTPTSTR